MDNNYRPYNPNAAPPPPISPPTSIPDYNNHQQLQHQQRPPPPTSIPDYNNRQQLQHQQRPPTLSPQAQWYPNQSHYQPPPPPPGMQNQYPTHQQQHWSPHHQTESHAPYPSPPVPYPNQQYPPPPLHQFPPINRPQIHPPPTPYHVNQVPTQPFSAGHQKWGNPNWAHHQGYKHPGQGNSADWASRAKAWAAAKTAMDSQQQLSPFPHSIRPDLQSQFHDQYENVTDPQHRKTKSVSHTVAYSHNPYGVENYQHVPLTDGQSNNMPDSHQYGQVAFSSAPITSGPDNHLHKDGSSADESRTSVHQKEVPSSYSSSAGGEVVTNQNQLQFSSYPGPGTAYQGGHQLHPMVPAVDQSDLLGRPFSYHNQNGDLSDKPLDFAPRGNVSSVYSQNGQSGHHIGGESPATMPINHGWASHLAPGSMYPSAANSGSQFDLSLSAPSPVPGQVAPLFGTVPAPNFQSVLPSLSGPMAPGGLTSLVPGTTFPVDAYGASSADRPKKAAVPNWLKEEIIKKKVVMATSVHEFRREETQTEDEIGRQSFVQDDRAESKSVDSSRSAEEEDDEDYVEAARTAAINKEIKRILTEVLLKVTDDLFDEIATRVLSEEEVTTEAALYQSSAKVHVPNKSKGTDAEEDTGNPSSELPGGLLGLVSYGTDSDDENDEISTQEQMSKEKHEMIRYGRSHDDKAVDDTKSSERMDATLSMVGEVVPGTAGNDRKQQNGISSLDLKNNVRDKEQSNQDRCKDASSRDSRIASDERVAESQTSSRSILLTDTAVDRLRENQSRGKHEEKHHKVELDDHYGSKDRKKEESGTHVKQKDSVSRKRSSHYADKYKPETEGGRIVGGRENNRRVNLDDDKSERSTHKHSRNFSRHKKGRSPSPSSRRKKNKTDSSVSSGSSTNDESFDNSERKSRSKRRPRSPTPVRSRKRQVSQSPENSQRRQSSYHSFEASRKKRSRSRSPRRHR